MTTAITNIQEFGLTTLMVYYDKMNRDIRFLDQEISSKMSFIVDYIKSYKKESAPRALESIPKILETLQYSDIIKQKIEHIIIINDRLISELMDLNNDGDQRIIDLSIYNFSKLNKLNIEKMKLIKKEFAETLEAIKTELLLVESSLNSEMTSTCSMIEVENIIDSIIDLLKPISNSEKIDDLSTRMSLNLSKLLERLHTMKSERIIHEKIFDQEEDNSDNTDTINETDDDLEIELF